MKKIFFPDYNNNLISITATVLDYFGIENKYAKNSLIKNELEKNYKNIVLMLFDGLGYNIVKNFSDPNGFLYKNLKASISTVFPPTTTAATSAFHTASYPSEHCWLGWKLYFKEIDNIVNLYPNTIAYKDEPLSRRLISEKYPLKTIYEKLEAKKMSYNVITVFPPYIKETAKINISYEEIEEQFNIIKNLCENEGKNFIVTYNDRPDKIMHDYKQSSAEVQHEIEKINRNLEKLCDLEDTLIIISADHGQVEIEKNILLSDDKELSDMLMMPPSIEPRAVNFFVKEKYLTEFKNIFNKKYGKEFILMSKEEIIEKKLFGLDSNGDYLEFIGDFLALGISSTMISFAIPNGNTPDEYQGHHSGLTEEEMLVPLIIYAKK